MVCKFVNNALLHDEMLSKIRTRQDGHWESAAMVEKLSRKLIYSSWALIIMDLRHNQGFPVAVIVETKHAVMNGKVFPVVVRCQD